MKKIITLALALLMILTCTLVFASCGKDENTLVMATNANFPPYEYVGDDGAYAGIDVEIAQAIANKLGMKLEIQNVEFGSIIGGVQTGKFDMGMAGMTVTDERLEKINFTDSYATGIQSIIVKEGSPYTCLDDLYVLDGEGKYTAVKAGVKVGVQQDTTGDIYCSAKVEDYGFGEENVSSYKNPADAIQALISDKVSVVIIDNEPAKSFVATNSGLKILETAYTVEDYAICVSKKNTELLEKINKALAELKADGTIAAIVNKYIPAN